MDSLRGTQQSSENQKAMEQRDIASAAAASIQGPAGKSAVKPDPDASKFKDASAADPKTSASVGASVKDQTKDGTAPDDVKDAKDSTIKTGESLSSTPAASDQAKAPPAATRADLRHHPVMPSFVVNDNSHIEITVCSNEFELSMARNDFSSSSTEGSV